MMIEPTHPRIPMARQCELLGLSRSTLYYQARGEDAFNERLMRLIDEQYLRTPFYGVGQMHLHLNRLLAPERITINIKRVRRLMRLMGLEAVCPKPRTTTKSPENKVYPYLLKDLAIDRPDQVWATDITYIPMRRGWVYLVAIMDWFSRYVLAWELSVTLESSFCVSALRCALSSAALRGPEIFNSDQGSQFTSRSFTTVLREAEIAISMAGRGRAYDNIFAERLWRSVKYEEVYLHDYRTVPEAESGLERYFAFYNHERPHQGLGGLTPAERYGLATPPWPIEADDNVKEGDAERLAAASAFAFRAHYAAAAKAEPIHLNSPQYAPS
jgi:putative transposase